MSQEKKYKMCRCGREKIMTGRHRMFNYKDRKGRQVCGTCMMEEFLPSRKTT